MEEQIITFETSQLFSKHNVGVYLSHKVCDYEIDMDNNKIVGLNWDIEGYEAIELIDLYTPTQSLLQKVLREKYNIDIHVDLFSDSKYASGIQYIREEKKLQDDECECECDEENIVDNFRSGYGTYEQALEEGLQQALKLIVT